MELLRERRGEAVEVLTLNRPEARNALSPGLLDALADAWDAMAADDSVRAVVLTGAGELAFCSGMDLRAFAAGTSRTGDRPPFPSTEFPKPVVAAVNGAAVGGGFELALSCDLIVAGEGARFGLPEVSRGLLPAGDGLLLPARIPLALALELALTGTPMDADRAWQAGLVNRVVPVGAVVDEAVALAGVIAANAPLGVSASRRVMRAVTEQGAVAVRPMIDEAIRTIFASEDAAEGSRAFVEKRQPRWTGR